MNLDIYNVSQEYSHILEQLEENPTSENLKKQLKTIEKNYIDKILDVGRLIEEMIIVAGALKEHKKITNAKQKRIENNIDLLKEWIMDSMRDLGKKSINFKGQTLRIQKNPMKVVILDEDAIPDKYKREVTTTVIDKAKILEDYKAIGLEPMGCEVVQEESLRIL